MHFVGLLSLVLAFTPCVWVHLVGPHQPDNLEAPVWHDPCFYSLRRSIRSADHPSSSGSDESSTGSSPPSTTPDDPSIEVGSTNPSSGNPTSDVGSTNLSSDDHSTESGFASPSTADTSPEVTSISSTTAAPKPSEKPYILSVQDKYTLLDHLMGLMIVTAHLQTNMMEKRGLILENNDVAWGLMHKANHTQIVGSRNLPTCLGGELPWYQEIVNHCTSPFNESRTSSNVSETMGKSYCLLTAAAAIVEVMKTGESAHESKHRVEFSFYKLMENLQTIPIYGLYPILCNVLSIHNYRNEEPLLALAEPEIVPPKYGSERARLHTLTRVPLDFEMSHIICRLVSTVYTWVNDLDY